MAIYPAAIVLSSFNSQSPLLRIVIQRTTLLIAHKPSFNSQSPLLRIVIPVVEIVRAFVSFVSIRNPHY